MKQENNKPGWVSGGKSFRGQRWGEYCERCDKLVKALAVLMKVTLEAEMVYTETTIQIDHALRNALRGATLRLVDADI